MAGWRRLAVVAAGLALALPASRAALADAVVTLSGPTSNAGAIDLTTAGAQFGGEVTAGGITGYSLWGILGGANATSPTSPIYGAITTSTPAGGNGKNAILRYYVLATGSTGEQSLISLGEIDPNFGGGTNPALLTFNGNTASLAFTLPGAAGRDIGDLTSLQLLSVPALPSTPATQSTAVTLAGNVSHPGDYKFQGNDPQNIASIVETVNGDTYTGVPLFGLIAPSDPNILDQYVVTAGTDGYEVVLSLAELDPAFGASTALNQLDLVPFADTGGNFPGAAIARTILPGDNAHGRWESNLDLIEVASVPEPSTAMLVMSGLLGLGILRRRRGKTARPQP